MIVIILDNKHASLDSIKRDFHIIKLIGMTYFHSRMVKIEEDFLAQKYAHKIKQWI